MDHKCLVPLNNDANNDANNDVNNDANNDANISSELRETYPPRRSESVPHQTARIRRPVGLAH